MTRPIETTSNKPYITQLFHDNPHHNQGEWPFLNHRAEYVAKLLAIAVSEVVNSLTSENETTKIILFKRLHEVLYTAYQQLRSNNPDHSDPTLTELVDYAVQLCQQRITGIKNTRTEKILSNLIPGALDEIAMYELFGELQEEIKQHIRVNSNVSVLLGLPTPSILHIAASSRLSR